MVLVRGLLLLNFVGGLLVEAVWSFAEMVLVSGLLLLNFFWGPVG